MKILVFLLRLIFLPIKLLLDLIYGPTKPNLVGYAWYDKNQYQRFLASSQDNIPELVPTYDGWLNKAEKNIEIYKAKGWIVFKVKVDIDSLDKWLKDNCLENVVENREKYINYRLEKFLNKSII